MKEKNPLSPDSFDRREQFAGALLHGIESKADKTVNDIALEKELRMELSEKREVRAKSKQRREEQDEKRNSPILSLPTGSPRSNVEALLARQEKEKGR